MKTLTKNQDAYIEAYHAIYGEYPRHIPDDDETIKARFKFWAKEFNIIFSYCPR